MVESTCNAGDPVGFYPWVRKIPCRREWQPTPVFLPGVPWTEEPGGLQYMGLQRVRYNRTTNTFTFNYQSKGSFQAIIAQNCHCYLNISHGLLLVPKKGFMLSWLSHLGLKFFSGSLMALVLTGFQRYVPIVLTN